jgi:hypothetical protein
MAAKFDAHLKNKDLMKLFKRLCSQNQEQKFNALWKVLDDLTMKHSQAQAGEGPYSTPTPSQESSSRHFTHWIHDSPKERWVLLYDSVVVNMVL